VFSNSSFSNSSKGKKSYLKTLGKTVPMPTHFRNHGYKTMAAGKVFHKGTSDIRDYQYWDEARPKFKWPAHLAARGHGYQGKSAGHFYPFPKDGGAIYQMYQQGVDGQSLCWGALDRSDIPADGMPDEQVADWAVERLSKPHELPFFMAIGFVRPHVPYTAPREFFDEYPLESIKTPDVPDDEMDDIPLWGKTLAYGTIPGGDHHNVQKVGRQYWRELIRAYLACVSFVDAQAGKVLDALENGPNADNTIVIFWSDHGQHLGEKRHWRKMALWEESTRVPLAISLPGKLNGGASVQSAVSLLDLYPTLISLCDLPSVHGLEGTSLEPQLKNPLAIRRTPVVTTWQYNNHAVRSLNHRYIRYRDGSEELYDHRTDPNEHENVAKDPAYADVKKQLANALPKRNRKPASFNTDGNDSYGVRYEMLREQGVPTWLGSVPGAEVTQ